MGTAGALIDEDVLASTLSLGAIASDAQMVPVTPHGFSYGISVAWDFLMCCSEFWILGAREMAEWQRINSRIVI